MTYGNVAQVVGTLAWKSFLFYTTKANLYCIDVTYRKLQLLREHCRASKAIYQEQMVPEVRWQGISKCCNCKFRVAISWPVCPVVERYGNIRPGLPYILTFRTSYNHDVHPDFYSRWNLQMKYTDKCGGASWNSRLEISLIWQYAVAITNINHRCNVCQALTSN